jgi:hypothetical protein
MKKSILVTLVVCVCFLAACQRRTKLGNPDYLPKNWITAKTTSWQVIKLPDVYQQELSTMKIRLIKERKGQYYNLFGRFNPETEEYIKFTIAELDEAFFNLQYSAEAILADVTPEMKTLADSHSEFKAGIANVNNQNRRMIENDWRGVRLLDQPSSLSEYPVVR